MNSITMSNTARRVCSHAYAACRRSDRLARREMTKGRSKRNILQSEVTERAGFSSAGATPKTVHRGVIGYDAQELESGLRLHKLKQLPRFSLAVLNVLMREAASEPTTRRPKVGSDHSSMHCCR